MRDVQCTAADGARRQHKRWLRVSVGALVTGYAVAFAAQQPAPAPKDAVAEAQRTAAAPTNRPEQTRSEHDRSNIFDPPQAQPSSPVFAQQPKEGKVSGFDFVRDPLNADRPSEDPNEIMKRLIAGKPQVMTAHRTLLQQRYVLEARLDPVAKMSRGKPLPVGPTARLQSGLTWERLAQMRPEEIKQQGVFPYPSLPHPLQANGGQVFPRMQIDMFPRLERVDVDFDLPDPFLPEFPPAIFLSNRPELGDVSRGEVVSINNYYRLFKSLLTPVQLDGLRLLLTPFPQEEFNPTDDRKSPEPSLGVTCLDCHVTVIRRDSFI